MKERVEALCAKLQAAVDKRAYDEIIAAAQAVLREDPGNASALEYLTCAYVEKGDKKKALEAALDFSARWPDLFMAQFLVARGHHLREEYGETLKILLQLEKQNVNVSAQKRGLLYNLLGNTYKILGETKRSLYYFEKAILPELDSTTLAENYDSYLFNLHYPDGISSKTLYQAHVRYSEIFSKIKRYRHSPASREKPLDNRIRVGYISPDIRDHVVIFFSYKLFTAYDKEKFHVTCYMRGTEDAISREIQSKVDAWRNVSRMSDVETARLIYEDRIDILVELAGHTKGNALSVLAYKPAPVQLCGIGYFDTTGLKTVDYFLTDRHCDPPGQNDAQFVERLIRLPHSHFCYTAPDTALPCGETPCLRNGFVTFGSFNNFSKTTDAMLLVWKRILQALPGSKLILKNSLFNGAYGREYTKKRLARLGFSLAQVEFRPETAVYLPEYREIDIALDTYPYPGGGTSCDALYMGVPVITLVGERHGSRFGYSLLKNLALEDCIAFSAEEYVEKALALAGDEDRLNCLHLHLRERMQISPLMDGSLYMREIETAYLEIWRAFLEGREVQCRWEDDFSRLSQAKEFERLCADALNAGAYYRVHEVYVRAREIETESASLALTAARAYLALREYARAFNAAQRACEQGADSIQAKWIAAEASERRFDTESAIRLYQEILIACAERVDERRLEMEQKAWIALIQLYNCVLGDARTCMQGHLMLMQCFKTEEAKGRVYSAFLMTMHYESQVKEEWLFFLHRRFEQFFRQIPRYEHNRKPAECKKLRIGYLSPDFRQHAVAFFCYQLLSKHDKERFEVICYALAGSFDKTTEQLRGFGQQWRDLRDLAPDEAAKIIYEDQIDILFELAGHTTNNGLPILAYRPAPVQISGIGYFDTTGLSVVDYFLTDVHVDPPGHNDPYFTEKLLRLAHSHLCYTARSDAPLCAAAPFLRNGYVTFCSFNAAAKLTDEVLLVWKRILERLPDARLLLKNSTFRSAYGRECAQERFKRLGLPLERICMRSQDAFFMQEYLEADIALDTFPYPGGATTCDALYMGVPVVTLTGKRHGARFGYSILKNIGLEACIAFSQEEYIEKAVSLARDETRLQELHLHLRAQMQASPLMNGMLYTREIEAAYIGVWQAYLSAREGKGPIGDVSKIAERCWAALQQKDYALLLYLAQEWLAGDAENGDAHFFLARAYFKLRAFDDAISYAEAALQKGSCYAVEAYQILGMTQIEKQEYIQAANAFAQGLAIVRKKANGSKRWIASLAQSLGVLRTKLGEYEVGRNLHLLASQASVTLKSRVESYSSYLLALHCDPSVSPEALSEAHRRYAEFFVQVKPYRSNLHRRGKIKIGYLSPDFRQHVMLYFYYQLLAHYDKTQFHVTCYSLGPEDVFTEHLRGLVDDWRDLRGKSYEEAAAAIYADEIDILYDLAGHSGGSGLPILAYRPAAVQLSGLGYMSTTGLPAVDFFVGDVFTDPFPQDDVYFTERLLRLSRSHFCYTGRSDVGRSEGAPCKKNGYVTFCSFNRYDKLTDEMLAAWKEILDRTPAARLVLKCKVFASGEVQALVRQRLTRLGFTSQSVELRPETRRYMDEYLDMDIALDTYPYQGGGTTCDALYMGVPVVTLMGDCHSRRFGYSILKNAGLEELVAEDFASYVDKAVALAGDAELLDVLHKNLRNMLLKSPLLDERAYVQEMETLYKYLAENGAESF